MYAYLQDGGGETDQICALNNDLYQKTKTTENPNFIKFILQYFFLEMVHAIVQSTLFQCLVVVDPTHFCFLYIVNTHGLAKVGLLLQMTIYLLFKHYGDEM